MWIINYSDMILKLFKRETFSISIPVSGFHFDWYTLNTGMQKASCAMQNLSQAATLAGISYGAFSNTVSWGFPLISIRFECEIPDKQYQSKIFIYGSNDKINIGYTDVFVNVKRFLMANDIITNNAGFGTFQCKEIKINGIIEPYYIDDNGDKIRYRVRFMNGFMAGIKRI